MGKKTISAHNTITGAIPYPIHSTSNGASAIAGIAWVAPRNGWKAAAAHGDRWIRIANGKATPVPISAPPKASANVISNARQYAGSVRLSTNWCTTWAGAGIRTEPPPASKVQVRSSTAPSNTGASTSRFIHTSASTGRREPRGWRDARTGRERRKRVATPRAASHPDFHRRSRNSTRSTDPASRTGSRTITAGSDLHRPRSTFVKKSSASNRMLQTRTGGVREQRAVGDFLRPGRAAG